jgi:hypothetical protein
MAGLWVRETARQAWKKEVIETPGASRISTVLWPAAGNQPSLDLMSNSKNRDEVK